MRLAHAVRIQEALLSAMQSLECTILEDIRQSSGCNYFSLVRSGQYKRNVRGAILGPSYTFRIHLLKIIEDDSVLSQLFSNFWVDFLKADNWWNNSGTCTQVAWNKSLPVKKIEKQDETILAQEMFEAWKSGLTTWQKQKIEKFKSPRFEVQLLECDDTKRDRIEDWHLDCDYGLSKNEMDELILVWTDSGESEGDGCGTLYVDNSFIFRLSRSKSWDDINNNFESLIQTRLRCSATTAKTIKLTFKAYVVNTLQKYMVTSFSNISHVKQRHIANVPCQHLHRSSNKPTKYRNHIVVSVVA